MSWSSTFVNGLKAPSITPIYRLHFWQPNPTYSVGKAANVTYSTNGKRLRIGPQGVKIIGTSVIPVRWSVSFGGFEIQMTGDIAAFDPSVKRGSLAIVECALKGLSNYEIIAIGQLASIEGVRGNYTFRFRDLVSSLQMRHDTRIATSSSSNPTNNTDRKQFFWSSYKSSAVTSTWNPSDTTLTVDNSSIFEKSTDKDGAIYCVPISGADPFYLYWTSAPTGTTLAVTGTAQHPTQFGHTASVLGNNSRIHNAIRLSYKPHAIFGELITSTGTGTNGPRDHLPMDWSSGLQLPHALYDNADAELSDIYIRGWPTGLYNWNIVYKDPLQNGIRTLLDLISKTGQWPVFRQNSFSWRGCTDPTGKYGPEGFVVAKISDDAIINIESHQMYDPTAPSVYGESIIAYNTVSSSGITTQSKLYKRINPILTLPAEQSITRDNSFLYDSSPGLNPVQMATCDRDRMFIWDTNPWQKITLKVKIYLSVLVAGDIVEISSRYLKAIDTKIGKSFKSRRGMIISTEYNINQQFCVIVIAVPPIL